MAMREGLNKPVLGRLLYAVAALAFAAPIFAQTTPQPPVAVQAPPRPRPPIVRPRNTMVKAFGGRMGSAPLLAPNQTAPSAPAQSVLAAPPVETPHWPANQAPEPATVRWDSQGLEVNAANSSLRQILTDIAARTGAKLEGLSSDERVYGVYGPGPARDILAQLLHGTDYNIMLIGEQGQGTPREIILTHRSGSAAAARPNAPSQPQDSDDDAADQSVPEEQPEPQQPPQPPINQLPHPFNQGQPVVIPPQPQNGQPPQ